METLIIILVVLVLLGVVGYAFVRETGIQQAKLWFISSRQLRKTFDGIGGDGRDRDATQRLDLPAREGDGAAASAAIATQSNAHVPGLRDDGALRELREEVQGELMRASGVTREFDARLTRIETVSTALPQESERLRRAVDERDAARQREIERLRDDLARVRQDAGARGQRRGEAVGELYGHLARVEASLGSVVNPMLLPGEPLAVPEEFFPETLDWDNWSDVGERAYAFGDAFNQSRFVLDRETAGEIERFIGTLRQGLTGAVYPTVRTPSPTTAQLAQMRAGVQSIVAALPEVRQTLERVYRGDADDDGEVVVRR